LTGSSPTPKHDRDRRGRSFGCDRAIELPGVAMTDTRRRIKSSI
jgi:hypothetical protein